MWLTSETIFFRVASPSVGAEADGSVLLSATNGVLTADRSAHDARVLTDELFACLVEWTVSV